MTSLTLATPDSFPAFPCQPYDIQLALMKHVYAAVEAGVPAVVESPTGTGKSLSLICSTLSWLFDDADRARKVAVEGAIETDRQTSGQKVPKWMIEQDIQRRINELEHAEQDLRDRLAEVRQNKLKRQQEAKDRAHYAKKRKLAADSANAKVDDDERFAPDEYEPDQAEAEDGLTPAVRAMLKAYDGNAHAHRPRDTAAAETKKILFASRTHSQLSQFAAELRKTTYADKARIIPLGSRQNLCINDKLRSSCSSVDALNDRCLDLQKAEKGQRCEFLPGAEDKDRLDTFADHALAEVHNIEDLEDLGRQQKVCPYYGCRSAVPSAHIVTLPYNLLLMRQAREALGVQLKDNIVVVDEAHNLIDTILSIHSVEIGATQLGFFKGALLLYLKRFSTRLKGSNAVYLKQLLGYVTALEAYCKEHAQTNKKEEMLAGGEIIAKCGLDQTNLRALDKYLSESKVAQKLSGYMESLDAQQGDTAKQSRAAKISSIYRIQAFLLSLSNSEKDGRVLLRYEQDKLLLKYQLLNPADVFGDFAQARSIIIAGGTMAPLSDFAQQVLSFAVPSSVRDLSLQHVVPSQHVLARAISNGPSGHKLEYKYEQRNDVTTLDEYGNVVLNLVTLVHKGIVLFFPSYSALDGFMSRWLSTGLLAKLKAKREVLVEPKDGKLTEQVLREYTTANDNGKAGGLLLAVIGGRLSEGINFQDDLCRCVAVIGIPYPSSQSIELKERMRYMASLPAIPGLPSGEAAGKRLYSNLAFRAVNQSIGRSIRHINDWSAILLLDARYALPATQSKLPGWIQRSLQTCSAYPHLVRDLATFMRDRKHSVMS